MYMRLWLYASGWMSKKMCEWETWKGDEEKKKILLSF